MIEETQRPYTEAERRLMRKRATTPAPGKVYWMRDERISLARTLGICAAILAAGSYLRTPVTAFMAAVLFTFGCFGGYCHRRRMRAQMRQFSKHLTDELNAGIAQTITCRPARIFEREEIEDEGAVWIFDGGDGRYLALSGQDYYETARFPSTHFEIVMGSRHKTVLGIRCLGVKMPSSTIVSGRGTSWNSIPEADVIPFPARADAELHEVLEALRNTAK
jgi:hypothetical protein